MDTTDICLCLAIGVIITVKELYPYVKPMISNYKDRKKVG